MGWKQVARADELPPGALIEVVQDRELYALCNVDGEVRALSGRCPHHGGPLGQGALEGSLIACPWHAWQFDSATGACAFNDQLRIPTYAVRIESGAIFVNLGTPLNA